jgi:hypothetical protein
VDDGSGNRTRWTPDGQSVSDDEAHGRTPAGNATPMSITPEQAATAAKIAAAAAAAATAAKILQGLSEASEWIPI